MVFQGKEGSLVGILTRNPEAESGETGVLIVVGGPQNRVGSHRQFVYLSRALAKAGIPSFRFDYSGMGDGEGELSDYLSSSDDILTAIDIFTSDCEGIKEVVLWGLCDAASAALLFMQKHADPRVTGLVLLNPWVRLEKNKADTIVRHYYLKRLTDPQLWKKVLKPNKAIMLSAFAFLKTLTQVAKQKIQSLIPTLNGSSTSAGGSTEIQFTNENYVSHMYRGLKGFEGAVLFILSEFDMTADEFRDLLKWDASWKAVLGESGSKVSTVKGANHTFSSSEWRSEVESLTSDFVLDLVKKSRA